VGVAYLLALETVNGREVSPEDNIRLDQALENGYIGLHNGILDQSIILLSEAHRLLFLDCASRDYRTVALPPGAPEYRVAVVYSGVSEALVGTDYNRRVAQCEAAARQLLQRAGRPTPTEGVKLRHVPPEVFAEHGDALPPELARRARHYFTEIQRVRDGVAAWERGDLAAFGRFMRESGRSSIENYECGRPELTTIYEILCETPGVFGARFSGAGFRGSCIALLDPAHAEDLRATVTDRYLAVHPCHRDRFEVHLCQSAGGARVIPVGSA
jgi:galactokinase/galacturonokinase